MHDLPLRSNFQTVKSKKNQYICQNYVYSAVQFRHVIISSGKLDLQSVAQDQKTAKVQKNKVQR